MPEQRQITVNATSISSPRAKGDRNESNLRSAFSASPIYTGEISDEGVKTFYQQDVLDATIVGGNGLNSANLNYPNAPVLEDVDLTTHNLPSPYMPNPTSPGPGSINALDKPEYTGNIPDPEFNVEFGTGIGGLASPDESAAQISKQGTLNSYISGKSYIGSDGVP